MNSSPTLPAVAARRDDWCAALNDDDPDAYLDLVAEDLVWLPPMGAPIEGREAFRRWLEPFMERFEYEFAVAPAHIRPFDGWCAETGRFRSVLTEKTGGEPRAHGGHYFVLWRLDDDGVWRMERYVDGVGAEAPGKGTP